MAKSEAIMPGAEPMLPGPGIKRGWPGSIRAAFQSAWWTLLLAAFLPSAGAAGYTLDWWTIDGGGTSQSTGGVYTLSSTIGQPDAGTMAGGIYALQAGFWNVDTLMQSLLGLLQMEFFAGPAGNGIGSRAVTFKATTAGGAPLQTWTVPLAFTNGAASFTLAPAPLGLAHLSAKTDWHLRTRQPVSFTNGVGVANFTGPSALRAGDLDNSNLVDLGDYFRLAYDWYSAGPAADFDGSGFVDLDDYFLLANRWGLSGDPE